VRRSGSPCEAPRRRLGTLLIIAQRMLIKVATSMKRALFVYCGLLFVVNAHAAHAPTSVGDYERYKAAQGQDWKEFVLYLRGVYQGISWSDGYLRIQEVPRPMYCPPTALRFDMKMVLSVLDKELADEKAGKGVKEPITSGDPIEPVLLYGLIHRYPCTK
jgi:hypothetical protein